jgi:hypothetical protein
MSEQDRSDGPPRAPSDQTLLGLAPPPTEPAALSSQRSPVFVRSGTSVADVEPPPVPRMALPSRPPSSPGATGQAAAASSLAPPGESLDRTRRVLSSHPALWMLLAPGVLAVAAIALLRATAVHHGSKLLQTATSANTTRPSAPPVAIESAAEQLARLKTRPPESLTARELARLAEAQTDEARAAGKALRAKIEDNPALGRDPALQRELLRFADDARTSTDALSAMAALEASTGADLLYEVWTHTPVRTDATDLARALVYSTDVRPKASPALAVALDLRLAERCEQYKAILPNALKDGDRRSAHLLLKLSGKHGCGPKKRDDCYACLREQPDELTATINAVKSRRSPEFSAP